jgi:chain length determinant protein EpsF
MNIFQLLLIFKARLKIIVVTFSTVMLIAILACVFLPKTYMAATSLLINYKGQDPVTGMILSAQMMPGYMATQVEIIQSRNIALKVVKKLGFEHDAKAQAQFQAKTGGNGDINYYYADLLLTNLFVVPSPQSSLLEIDFKSPDPAFSALIANEFAEQYVTTNLQLKVEPAQKAATFFSQQTKALRESYAEAQNKLSQFQQEHGITNPQQSLDVESMRLGELSSQLSAIQVASIDSQSRNAVAKNNSMNSPDIAQSAVVNSLKVQLNQAEAKLADVSQQYGVNHPLYAASKAEVEKVKGMLRAETSSAASAIGGSASINQARESELRTQVEKQKKKVLELNAIRDQMLVLAKDVEVAQNSLDLVNQRFSQTNVEGNSNQSDVTILNPAIPPTLPYSPKILYILFFAILFGGFAAIGLALVVELLDKRVRSIDDMSQLLQIPVFELRETKGEKTFPKLLPAPVRKLLS